LLTRPTKKGQVLGDTWPWHLHKGGPGVRSRGGSAGPHRGGDEPACDPAVSSRPPRRGARPGLTRPPVAPFTYLDAAGGEWFALPGKKFLRPSPRGPAGR
jgi:hypothetical protein